MKINITNSAVLEFSNKLVQLHKSALPVAVRTALNSAAFDVKQRTLQKSADENFVKRQKNFFKANSRVEQAAGFNVNSMKATIGMVEGGLKGENNYAVKDLEQQEKGGTIGGKSFIPLDAARISRSKKRNVSLRNRISSMKGIFINISEAKGKNWEQRAIKSAVHSKVGGIVFTGGNGKGGFVYRITEIQRNGRNTRFKKETLFSFNKNRKISVKSTNFMRNASLDSAKRMEEFYIIAAKKQIEKYLK